MIISHLFSLLYSSMCGCFAKEQILEIHVFYNNFLINSSTVKLLFPVIQCSGSINEAEIALAILAPKLHY